MLIDQTALNRVLFEDVNPIVVHAAGLALERSTEKDKSLFHTFVALEFFQASTAKKNLTYLF